MKTKLCVVAVVALLVWGMKRYYSDAAVDELSWILGPTAHVVGVTTGTAFTIVSGEGYVSHERLFVIEKSCAGINFLIAAFAMLVCAFFRRIFSPLSFVTVVGLSLAASYVAAVIVNSTRIVIAMWLAGRPLAWVMMTAAEVHRMEGIAVYFGGLMALYELAQCIDRVLLTAADKP